MADREMAGEVFSTSVQVRWGDSDRLGHVNNVLFVEYAQEARVQFLTAISTSADRLPVVVRKLELDYLHPLTDDSGPLDIDVWISDIGRTSCRIHHRMRDSRDRVCATVEVVVVGFDMATQSSRPWNDDERRSFEEHATEPAAAVHA